MLTSKMIKEAALKAGADKCGIAPMSRFEGAPPEMDPRMLFPEAKSCIGFVFRIPRGVQRGIEEGTQFYQYPSMAYGGINEIFAPAVLYSFIARIHAPSAMHGISMPLGFTFSRDPYSL